MEGGRGEGGRGRGRGGKGREGKGREGKEKMEGRERRYVTALSYVTQVILQHFYLRKDSILSQCEVWKVELEEAIKKIKQANVSVHLLREHLYSLVKSIETLRTELDKIKTEDFQSTNTVDEEES